MDSYIYIKGSVYAFIYTHLILYIETKLLALLSFPYVFTLTMSGSRVYQALSNDAS